VGGSLGAMARPIRVEFEGAVYHVMARGNERRAIFRSDQEAVKGLVNQESDTDVRMWARVRLGGEGRSAVAGDYGYGHPSGVTHAVKRVEAKAREDRLLAEKLEALRKRLSLFKS